MDLFDKFQKGLKNTKNEDLIKYFFEFVILNEYKLNCQHKIIKNEFLFTLELEVDNHNNINNSLKYLFDYKNLDNENLIYCSICKKKMKGKNKLLIDILPRILIIVLKRFKFNKGNITIEKNNEYFSFPILLDMSKYTKDFNNNLNLENKNLYYLKTVIIHDGSTEGGHYYNIIKDNKSSSWYKINDEYIESFDINNLEKESFGGYNEFNEIKRNNAYLLFYEKEYDDNCIKYNKICLNKAKRYNYNIQIEEDDNIANIDNSSESEKSDTIYDEDMNVSNNHKNDLDLFMNTFGNMKINDNSNLNLDDNLLWNNYDDNIYEKKNSLKLNNNNDFAKSKAYKDTKIRILNQLKPKKRKTDSDDHVNDIKRGKSIEKKKKK